MIAIDNRGVTGVIDWLMIASLNRGTTGVGSFLTLKLSAARGVEQGKSPDLWKNREIFTKKVCLLFTLKQVQGR